MPLFSANSINQLSTCHPELQRLFYEVIKHRDCSVTEGFRNKEKQNEAYAKGNSDKKWPDGKHNKYPSLAVDVYPYPIDYTDKERFYNFAGFVQGVAEMLDIKIRWGGDWDGDNDLHDQKLMDLVHFELIV